MRDPTEEHSLSTIIYFLVALIVALVGLVLVLSHPGKGSQSSTMAAIGDSLLAGGVASIGFGLLRYIDDSAERRLREQVSGIQAELNKSFDVFQSKIEEFVISSARSVRLTSEANARCVSDTEIGQRFRIEYARFALGDTLVHVDVLGLKLYRFLDDQLEWLLSRRHNTYIRLLLQNPDSPVFEEICNLEARNLQATKADITRTIDSLGGATVEGGSLTWQNEQVRLELRFFERYQPVTLFRVQDVIYVRPRVSTPLGASSRFYEVYESRDSMPHYTVQLRHFEKCWRESRYSTGLAL